MRGAWLQDVTFKRKDRVMLDTMATFDFEEQAVRVILRDGEPWFVAADVCRVLDLENVTRSVERLDDDERMTLSIADINAGLTLHSSEGQTGRGGARYLTIISESGLYALIFTSRKEAAKRFRKWVTSEVLPALRNTGRYEMPEVPDAAPGLDALAREEVSAWLTMVREARLLRGRGAAIALWDASPLPPLPRDPDDAMFKRDTTFTSFLKQCCVITGDPSDRVRARDLIDAFKLWCIECRLPRQTDRAVALQLANLSRLWRDPDSGLRFRRVKTSGIVVYEGVKMRKEDQICS